VPHEAPPPTLGIAAPCAGRRAGGAVVRLPVLRADANALALEVTEEAAAFLKGTGASLKEAGGDLVGALRRQFAAGKPEFLALPFRPPFDAVWPIDCETAGVALFAAAGAPLARWRNAHGSDQLVFVYQFLAGDESEGAFACELPVAIHREKPVALVSRNTGKKARTEFRLLERAGRWAWWEARTTYPRFHQVRLHAAECGLRIVGEAVYAAGDVITLEMLLPKGRLNKGAAQPLHDGLVLRLASVETAGAGIAGWQPPLVAGEPRKWAVLRRRIKNCTLTPSIPVRRR
jgi:hypothetical protein